MCLEPTLKYEDVRGDDERHTETRVDPDIAVTPGVHCEALCEILNKSLLILVK